MDFEIINLSNSLDFPSYILQDGNVTILFECPLIPIPKENCSYDTNESQPTWFDYATPNFNLIDVSLIDVVLLTNVNSMLALPFLMNDNGFNGRIFCTEPVFRIGKNTLFNFSKWLHSKPVIRLIDRGKYQTSQNCNKEYYNRRIISKCLSKIDQIYFKQLIHLNDYICLEAVSSGYSLGSCNWLVYVGTELLDSTKLNFLEATYPFRRPIKFSYISHSAAVPDNFISTFDDSVFNNVNYTLLGSGTKSIECLSIDEVSNIIEKKIRSCVDMQTNILIPTHLFATTLLILENLYRIFLNDIKNNDFGNIPPIYLIGENIHSDLCYATIMSEWLSSRMQDIAFLPEIPFTFETLKNLSILKIFKSIDSDDFRTSFKSPCIILTGNSTYFCGELLEVIKLWGKSKNNHVILTDPINYNEYMESGWKQSNLSVSYIPIETRLTCKQIFQRTNASLIFGCSSLKDEWRSIESKLENKSFYVIDQNDHFHFPINQKYEIVLIDKQLINNCRMKLLRNNSTEKSNSIVYYGLLKNVKLSNRCITPTTSDVGEETLKDLVKRKFFGTINISILIWKFLKANYEPEIKKVTDYREFILCINDGLATCEINMVEKEGKSIKWKSKINFGKNCKGMDRKAVSSICLTCLTSFHI
ncbi:hypothetical protein SNEBB_009595 [Seison nebaliae]|nr:hypothetical protein SNEBB_009595 [Seison nebaliae]